MRRYCIIIVLLIMIFLINCEKEITIEFNTNGGTHVQSVVLNDIKLFKLPDNPIKDGFEFDGWYLDSELSKEFNHLQNLNNDIVLYAKWKKIISINVGYEGKGSFGFDEENLSYTICEKITNADKLIELSSQMKNGFFDESSNSYNSKLGIKVRSYDNDYFVNNDLIICVFDAGNHYNYNVNNIINYEDALIVNIDKNLKIGTFTDESFAYIILIEINKKDIGQITDVSYVLKEVSLDD